MTAADSFAAAQATPDWDKHCQLLAEAQERELAERAAQTERGTVTEYKLILPYPRPPGSLHGNSRPHWSARTKDTATARATVMVLAKAAGIRPCAHLTVELLWSPGDNRPRDEDNLWPFLKALADGLARGPVGRAKYWAGLDLVPDDTPEYMDKRKPRILSPKECREVGMWLVVTTADEPPVVVEQATAS